MAKRKQADGCPSQLIVNTKGDCVDAVTKEAADGCCKTCLDTVKSAEASYNEQIAAYMGTCKLTREDVDGSSWVNPDKICSEECQALPMEIALLQIDFNDLEEACVSMPQELVGIEPIDKLLDTFQSAWLECRKAPETTTLEPETTTTELVTTSQAFRFPHVQISGPHDWRLVRDSSSISAGLGTNINELAISVTPPGIPADQISGWQHKATDPQTPLNVKHAVFGGTALKLEVQAEMLYSGSYQGKGSFLKDVKLKVTQNKVDFPHVMTADVKAVEAQSHGDPTNPVASVALIMEVKAEGRILFKVQGWKKTMKFVFWGNGHIQSYFM